MTWAIPDADAEAWFRDGQGARVRARERGVLYVLTRRYLMRAERTAEQLREAYDQTLKMQARALNVRDHSTGQHTQRVTDLTVEHSQIASDRGERARRHPTRCHPARHRRDRHSGRCPSARRERCDDETQQLIRRHPDVALACS